MKTGAWDERTPAAGEPGHGLSRRAFLRKLGGTAALASVGMSAAGVGLLACSRADARTVQRSLPDFLSAQGTFCLPEGMSGCLTILPPFPNYIAWADGMIYAQVDHAGVANRWANGVLGTQVSGRLSERWLADGRAQVDVNLQTTQALAIAGLVLGTPLLFGHFAPDVLAGAGAAFATSSFQLSFINTAPGAPFPDLEQLAFFSTPGQELILTVFHETAQGTLRSAFGVPDGTAGTLTVASIAHVRRPKVQGGVVSLRPTGG